MREKYSKSEEAIAAELLNNERLSVSDISERTHLPTWKVSRVLKRLEIRGFVRHEVEDRHERGRPKKFYELRVRASAISAEGGGDD